MSENAIGVLVAAVLFCFGAFLGFLVPRPDVHRSGDKIATERCVRAHWEIVDHGKSKGRWFICDSAHVTINTLQ